MDLQSIADTHKGLIALHLINNGLVCIMNILSVGYLKDVDKSGYTHQITIHGGKIKVLHRWMTETGKYTRGWPSHMADGLCSRGMGMGMEKTQENQSMCSSCDKNHKYDTDAEDLLNQLVTLLKYL